MRAAVLLSVAACSGTAPVAPVGNVAPPAPAAPDAATADVPDLAEGHGCEPILRCGMWSDCVWLEHTGPRQYRAGGERFERRPYCAEDARGQIVCALHCVGERCYDGLHPIDEVCTGAGFPSRSSVRCNLGDGGCQSLM